MTKTTRTLNVWALTVALAGTATAANAQTPSAAAPKAQGPSATPQAAQDRYVVGQAKAPDVAGRASMNLTLEQAIQVCMSVCVFVCM